MTDTHLQMYIQRIVCNLTQIESTINEQLPDFPHDTIHRAIYEKGKFGYKEERGGLVLTSDLRKLIESLEDDLSTLEER